MSLDVYLTMPGHYSEPRPGRIYVRENGQNREITRDEWEQRHPGTEPYVSARHETSENVFAWNITHNLGKMAGAAGLYKAMWRPEEIGVTHAAQLIPLLEAGLVKLEANPEAMKVHNPSNGWGDYDGLLEFTRAYLEACRAYPHAEIYVSR